MSDSSITLYVSPGCPLCAEARAFLVERGVQFAEVEVKEPDDLLELLRLAGEAIVPTIVAGADVQVGFDRSRVEEMAANPMPQDDRFSVLRAILDCKTAPAFLGLEEEPADDGRGEGPLEGDAGEEWPDSVWGEPEAAAGGEGNTSAGMPVVFAEEDEPDR